MAVVKEQLAVHGRHRFRVGGETESAVRKGQGSGWSNGGCCCTRTPIVTFPRRFKQPFVLSSHHDGTQWATLDSPES